MIVVAFADETNKLIIFLFCILPQIQRYVFYTCLHYVVCRYHCLDNKLTISYKMVRRYRYYVVLSMIKFTTCSETYIKKWYVPILSSIVNSIVVVVSVLPMIEKKKWYVVVRQSIVFFVVLVVTFTCSTMYRLTIRHVFFVAIPVAIINMYMEKIA